jgi:hypothetical protein
VDAALERGTVAVERDAESTGKLAGKLAGCAGEYKIASRSCAGLGLLCLRIRLHVDKQRAARVAPPRPCLVLAP